MSSSSSNKTQENTNFYLDITADVCPMTFVRTKLLIERMPPGASATVRLKGAEPLGNVPKSVREHGHDILSLEEECENGKPTGIHRLILRKADA